MRQRKINILLTFVLRQRILSSNIVINIYYCFIVKTFNNVTNFLQYLHHVCNLEFDWLIANFRVNHESIEKKYRFYWMTWRKLVELKIFEKDFFDVIKHDIYFKLFVDIQINEKLFFRINVNKIKRLWQNELQNFKKDHFLIDWMK